VVSPENKKTPKRHPKTGMPLRVDQQMIEANRMILREFRWAMRSANNNRRYNQIIRN